MKNAIKLVSILLLVSGVIFTSCDKNEEEEPKETALTQLSVSNITDASAKLTWNGTGNLYEIKVTSEKGSQKEYTSTKNSLDLTNLDAGTEYFWSVRTNTGNVLSQWVNGPNFRTIPVDLASLTVTFGSVTWTADYIEFLDLGGGYFTIFANRGGLTSIPYVEFVVNTSATTTTYIEGASFTGDPFFEYCETSGTYIGDVPVGDWMAYSGSLTITSNNGGRISGTANVVMIDAKVAYTTVPPDYSAEKRNLSLTFSNISLSNAAKTSKNLRYSNKLSSSTKAIGLRYER